MRLRLDYFFVLFITLGLISNSIHTSYILNATIASIIYLGLIFIANAKSSIQIMSLIGFSTFIYFPAILNGYFLGTSFELFFISTPTFYIFLRLTTNTSYQAPPDYNKHYLSLFLIYITILALSSLASIADLNYFILSTSVMLFALSLKEQKTIHNTILFLVFISGFSIYYIYGWKGFARTVTFGNLIVAILYFLYANKVKINKFLFAVAPVLASTLLSGRKEINLSEIDIKSVLSDSAFGPYNLASTFINDYQRIGLDILGFFEQVIFSIFIFIPRSYWPTKPYGFGFEYTVQNMEQSLIDAGNSIAPTLIGEHIYYLGWWGVATGVLMSIIVAILVNFFYKFQNMNGHALIIVSCNIMVLIWGGMSSFSPRLMMSLAGFIIALAILKIVKKLYIRNNHLLNTNQYMHSNKATKDGVQNSRPKQV